MTKRTKTSKFLNPYRPEAGLKRLEPDVRDALKRAFKATGCENLYGITDEGQGMNRKHIDDSAVEWLKAIAQTLQDQQHKLNELEQIVNEAAQVLSRGASN